MIEYTVYVHDDGGRTWFLNGKRHREDGPAVERADGTKAWFLNGEKLTEAEFKKCTACSGTIVGIKGVKYKLVEV